MKEITGVVIKKTEKGSSVLTIDGVPIAKVFEHLNGKTISLEIFVHKQGKKELLQSYSGFAEVFYYEGTQQFYSGTKYVNDFFIEEDDLLEVIESSLNEAVTVVLREIE